jgi:hypothetical protein
LIRSDHGAAIAALAARQPSERAFAVVDEDLRHAGFRHEIAHRQIEMLRTERIDLVAGNLLANLV